MMWQRFLILAKLQLMICTNYLSRTVLRLFMMYMFMFQKAGEEMDQVNADYAKMGFPGCVGSIDVTHLMWKQCPSALRHVCTTGHYYCPSVAFQMVCAHTRRIHHVSRPFYGATNDFSVPIP